MGKEFKEFASLCTADKIASAVARFAKQHKISIAKPPPPPTGRAKTFAAATPQMQALCEARAKANAEARAAQAQARHAEQLAITSEWDELQLKCDVFGLDAPFGTRGVPDATEAGDVFRRLLQLQRRADRAVPDAADEPAKQALRAVVCAVDDTVERVVGVDGWAGQPWALAYNRNEVWSSPQRAPPPCTRDARAHNGLPYAESGGAAAFIGSSVWMTMFRTCGLNTCFLLLACAACGWRRG